MSTNLEAVFRLILDSAVRSHVPESEMPDTILIMSDMQFNQAVTSASDTAVEMFTRLYAASGYKLPNVIFWNLRTSSGIPVKSQQKGVAVVSGYSPSILKHILGGELDPTTMMLRVLLSERYAKIN
jgi:hypothetical protein